MRRAARRRIHAAGRVDRAGADAASGKQRNRHRLQMVHGEPVVRRRGSMASRRPCAHGRQAGCTQYASGSRHAAIRVSTTRHRYGSRRHRPLETSPAVQSVPMKVRLIKLRPATIDCDPQPFQATHGPHRPARQASRSHDPRAARLLPQTGSRAGFMRATLADSDWAPSAVHAILEIGMAPGINARDLGNILRLDKSNTSRQLARLEAAGVAERRVSSDDARAIELYLTAEGKSSRRESTRSRRIRCRTRCAAWCPPTSRRSLRSLALYADALAQDNAAKAPVAALDAPAIREGYQPGCIGDIASLHARFMRNTGASAPFSKSAWRPSWPSSPVRCRPTARRFGYARKTGGHSRRSRSTATRQPASLTCAGSS